MAYLIGQWSDIRDGPSIMSASDIQHEHNGKERTSTYSKINKFGEITKNTILTEQNNSISTF